MVPLLLSLVMVSAAGGLREPGCPEEKAVGYVADIQIADDEPVEVRRDGETTWHPVSAGTTLCGGDQVRTRFRSRAIVRLTDGGREGAIDVVIGVNTRIRTTGDWSADSTNSTSAPVLELVHGVVRLSAPRRPDERVHFLRTGPTTCRYAGDEILANWDPFKGEANYLVADGRVSCSLADSTLVIDAGESLEIIRGAPQPSRPPVPLILESFGRATRMD